MFHFGSGRNFLQITYIKHSLPVIERRINAYVPSIQCHSFLKSIFSVSRSISTAGQTSVTVSYLTDSCGLSLDSASLISMKMTLKSPERADSVLVLLKRYGFEKVHITKLVTKGPSLLLADPEKSLEPKMKFLNEFGISGPLLVKIIVANPPLLRRSLKNHLVPFLNFFRRCFGSNEDFIYAINHSTQILTYNMKEVVIPNISIMREHGVPECWISREILKHARTLSLRPSRFREILIMVDEMGFDRLTSTFMLAVRIMASMSKSNWERKMNFFRSFGLSDDEILSAFKKQPFYMALSEEKVRSTFDFFAKKAGMSASAVCQSPSALLLSLEKRIIPRFAVMQLLLSKSIIKEKLSLNSLLQTSNLNFSKNFLTKYQRLAPELLMIYQRKVEDNEFELELK